MTKALTDSGGKADNSRDGFLNGDWQEVGRSIWEEIQRLRRPGQIIVKVHHDRDEIKVIEANVENNLMKVKR